MRPFPFLFHRLGAPELKSGPRRRRWVVFWSVAVCLFFFAPVKDISCQTTFAAKQLTFGQVAETEPNISPDGRWIAFQYFAGNEKPSSPTIWIMETAKEFRSAKALAGLPRYAGEMSWSPDSNWISFISSDDKPARSTEQIYKINILTMRRIQLTTFPEGTVIGDSTTWSKTGFIAFEREGKIFAIKDNGGEEMELLDPRIALSNRIPSSIKFSPDGNMLVFAVENQQRDQSEVWLADLPTRKVRRLTSLHFDAFPSWIDKERLLFSRETKTGYAQIYALSLRTEKLKRLTSGHVDFTPATDSSANTLCFSRKGKVQKNLKETEWLAGFHIWCVTNARRMFKELGWDLTPKPLRLGAKYELHGHDPGTKGSSLDSRRDR